MAVKRIDNIGIVVRDLDAAIAFFTAIGMELEGRTIVEGPDVDRLIALEGVRSEVAMLRTADGDARIEISSFHAPVATSGDPDAPVNTLGVGRIMLAVEDIDAVVARVEASGGERFGEIVQYGDRYRLAYVRGPEGVMLALAEELRPDA